MQNMTNYQKSVAAVVVKNNKVLLGRHTYGGGKGKFIIPGGYLNENESPEEAVKREVFEETSVEIEPGKMIGIRFNNKDWYVIFEGKYIEGTAVPDGEENDEVVWMDIDKIQERDDVPSLTKVIVQSYVNSHDTGLDKMQYDAPYEKGAFSFYGIK